MKQLDKEPDIEGISLDAIDTTSQWRVEMKEPEMEEPGGTEWLEEEDHTNDLEEETGLEKERGEEQQNDPLLVHIGC